MNKSAKRRMSSHQRGAGAGLLCVGVSSLGAVDPGQGGKDILRDRWPGVECQSWTG